jgi:hypothetical protein
VLLNRKQKERSRALLAQSSRLAIKVSGQSPARLKKNIFAALFNPHRHPNSFAFNALSAVRQNRLRIFICLTLDFFPRCQIG